MKDYELLSEVSEAMIQEVMIRLMLQQFVEQLNEQQETVQRFIWKCALSSATSDQKSESA